ncbi:MAG: uracil-DNA glycosylase [Sulfitobacter sp.]
MFDLSRLGAWRALPFFDDTLPQIETSLAQSGTPFLPPAAQVFAALEATQPDDVRVVIFGQDPYPQAGKGNGLAFSIPQDFPPRSRRDSLDNIAAELQNDLGVARTKTDLSDWAQQGVLLFNCLALTVPEGTPAGHRKLPWKLLTQQVIARLATAPRAYLLWGGDAHRAGSDVDAGSNLIIKSSHPSPLGVSKVGADFEAFRGARPFSRTNAWLRMQGHASINWGDPEGP